MYAREIPEQTLMVEIRRKLNKLMVETIKVITVGYAR